jgi:predicted amidohydrolase YtcJ
MLLRRVAVTGSVVDLRVGPDRIEQIGPDLVRRPDEEVVDGRGAAVIPGLHDHHLHLISMAAATASVRVGPHEVGDAAGLAAALAAADRDLPPGAWLRAVGYHESVAGPLDRTVLDRLVPGRPVRVQHRSGAEWSVNSAAVRELGLDAVRLAGVERDPAGAPTGRLRRLDEWLRDRLPRVPPDLAPVGARLSRYGVTGVTDATPFGDPEGFATLAAAVRDGALPQRVTVTGGVALAGARVPPGLDPGPVKVVLADPDLPGPDEVAQHFAAAHAAGRGVAVHCVTRAALVLALAAWDLAGSRAGDRIEHAAVVPPELIEPVRRHGLTVVTQPGFVAERGDRYLVDVDPHDRPFLYPCRSLIEHGIPVGGSTDAPFGEPDPWLAIRAAVGRRTAGGVTLGEGERIGPARALGLFLTPPDRPGGPQRTVAVGQSADLVLLDADLATVLADPDHRHVVATIRAGHIVHPAPPHPGRS